MQVAEPQMYRETAFERDGRDSNENAPRVYLQRPSSQAEADVADLYTIIIMSFPRRSRTAQLPRTVNGTGHTGPSEFCATSI